MALMYKEIYKYKYITSDNAGKAQLTVKVYQSFNHRIINYSGMANCFNIIIGLDMSYKYL